MHPIALLVALALMAAPLLSEQSADPSLMRFLKQQPEFRLITPEDVEPDAHRLDATPLAT